MGPFLLYNCTSLFFRKEHFYAIFFGSIQAPFPIDVDFVQIVVTASD